MGAWGSRVLACCGVAVDITCNFIPSYFVDIERRLVQCGISYIAMFKLPACWVCSHLHPFYHDCRSTLSAGPSSAQPNYDGEEDEEGNVDHESINHAEAAAAAQAIPINDTQRPASLNSGELLLSSPGSLFVINI